MSAGKGGERRRAQRWRDVRLAAAPRWKGGGRAEPKIRSERGRGERRKFKVEGGKGVDDGEVKGGGGGGRTILMNLA